jgi:hypothetical protein
MVPHAYSLIDTHNLPLPKPTITSFLNDKNKALGELDQPNVGVTHLTKPMKTMGKEGFERLRMEVERSLKENKVKDYIVRQQKVDGQLAYRMQGDGRGFTELKKEVKMGKYKISRDVGKVVALKHILDQNLAGEKVHGRQLKEPNSIKTFKKKEVREVREHSNEAAEKIFKKYLDQDSDSDEFETNPKKKNLMNSLGNKFNNDPTRRRMTKFIINKGEFVDNYAIKKKFEHTHLKGFLTTDFKNFTKPLPMPEIKKEEEEGKQKDKKKDDNEEDRMKRQIKLIQENNVLFEQEQDESELSEVKDPLILDRCKSDNFLKTTMNQFKIDSE